MKNKSSYYNRGGITIYNGDYLEVMKKFEDKSFDLVLTDPPYGTTACEWDTIPDLKKLWEVLKPLGKDNAAYVFTASQPFTSKLVMSNLKWFKYEWVWKKERPTNPLQCKKQPPKYHENILVFYRKQPIFNVTKILRKDENKRNNKPRNYEDATKVHTNKYSERVLSGSDDMIYQPNILEVPMQRGIHPTQNPVALMEYLIETYTNESDLILDPFMGSGTTLVAAKKLGRKAVGIEISEKYCQIAKERLKQGVLNI